MIERKPTSTHITDDLSKIIENSKTHETKLTDLNPDFELINENVYEHALILTLKTGYFSLKKTYFLFEMSKSIGSQIKNELKLQVHDKLNEWKEKKKQLLAAVSEYLQDDVNNASYLEPYKASKTALNGLKLVANKDIEILAGSDKQPLRAFFRVLNVLANNREEGNEVTVFIENVIKTVPGNAIKDVVQTCILDNFVYSEADEEFLCEYYKEYGSTIGQELLKISRSLSYMSFIVKEILAYLEASNRTFKGRKVKEIRYFNQEIESLERHIAVFERNQRRSIGV